jgi:hypothetical protein
VEDDQLSMEEAQQVWNEEAARLDAGEESPAVEAEAAAPEVAPQDPEPDPVETQPEQPEDPLAGLPEVVRAKLAQIDQLAQANAQLLHQVKSAEGRMAAIQREYQQARMAQQTVAPNQAPSQGQIATAAKAPEKWEQLKQDFPEWADAMEEYVAAKLGGVQPQSPSIDPQAVAQFVQEQVAQTKAEMSRLVEETRIEGKYEDWRDTVNSTEFAQWFTVQPPEVRALADSTAARDAIRMLDMFQQAKTKSATEIKQERGARLAAAATTRPGQTPPPKTMDDMSPAELWNYEARKREKDRAARGY